MMVHLPFNVECLERAGEVFLSYIAVTYLNYLLTPVVHPMLLTTVECLQIAGEVFLSCITVS